jgi:hypothetical protein
MTEFLKIPSIDSNDYKNYRCNLENKKQLERKEIQRKVNLQLYQHYAKSLDGSQIIDDIKIVDRIVWHNQNIRDSIVGYKVKTDCICVFIFCCVSAKILFMILW